ncbi:hypothetical protein GCM10028819_47240 [Spirosoma humi]
MYQYLFIPLIIKQGRPELLLNWIGCNVVTLLAWIVLYWFTTGFAGSTPNVAGNLAQFIIYPAIALIANTISSFFLLKE